MPTLTQLDYIVAVDRLRHFGRAAKACHISQPSLSMQVAKAEHQVGFSIFDRLKKPIEPTEKGRAFIEQAKTVLREHQRLLHLGQGSGTSLSGSLRLGVIPTLTPYLIPLFVRAFSETYPHIDLRIDEYKTSSLVQHLRDDTLDGGLAATPIGEEGLEEKLLFFEPFYLYAAPKHPLLAHRQIHARDLKGQPMWLLADGHCFRNQVVQLCGPKPEAQVLSNVSFEGGTLETLRQMVRQNGGMTVVPELFVQRLPSSEREAHVRPFIAPIPTRQISLIFRPGHWKTNLLEAIVKSILARLPASVPTQTSGAQKILPA